MKIYTQDINRKTKPIDLEAGERLFIEDDDGNVVTVGFTNSCEICVRSASDNGAALQVQPVASNCIYLKTKR